MKYTKRSTKTRKNRTCRHRQKGGAKKFTGLTYISAGTEGVIYKTADGRALKIQKSGRINEKEITVQRKLTELDLPYFPKLYEKEICLSTVRFDTVHKQSLTEFCDDVGPYQYDYVIMELINGKEYPQYLLHKLMSMGAWDRKTLSDAEVQPIAEEYINILCKLAFAFYCADKKMFFRHNDFDYKNSLIKDDGTPMIIDFGAASFFGSDNFNSDIPSGKDMLGFIRSTLGGSNLRSAIKKILMTPDNYRNGNTMNYIKPEKREKIDEYVTRYSSITKIIRESPLLRDIWRISQNRNKTILDYIKQLEAIKTQSAAGEFNHERSFRALGIPEDEIQKTKNIVSPVLPAPVAAAANLNSKVRQLVNMGIPEANARAALAASRGSVGRAFNFL